MDIIKPFSNFILFVDKVRNLSFIMFIVFVINVSKMDTSMFLITSAIMLDIIVLYSLISERYYIVNFNFSEKDMLFIKSTDFLKKKVKVDEINLNRIEKFSFNQNKYSSIFHDIKIRYYDNHDYVFERTFKINEIEDWFCIINKLRNIDLEKAHINKE